MRTVIVTVTYTTENYSMNEDDVLNEIEMMFEANDALEIDNVKEVDVTYC